MKLTALKAGLFFIAGLFLFTACSKDDDDTPPPPTKTQRLTAKQWRLTAQTINPGIQLEPGGPTITDLLVTYLPCQLDDFVKFNTNGTYSAEEGPTKCDPNDPQVIETGTWIWNADETRIIITPAGGSTADLLVTSLTSSQLVTQITFTDVVNGVPITYTLTSTYR
jgi:hypothetical protein